MSSDLNTIATIGRLTRDAELKYANTGTAILRFSIAVNGKEKQGDEWKDRASFFPVVYFGKGAEAIAQWMTKGKQVAIEGELYQSRWEADGKTQSRIEIRAESVQLLASPASRQEQPEEQASRTDTGDEYNDDIPY